MPLRPLGVFERALYVSDQHAPFNVVSVLRLENPPPPETLAAALSAVQARHPLLRAAIHERRFVAGAPPASFAAQPRAGDDDWLTVVEQEMRTRFAPAQGPLHRMVYLYAPQRAEVVWTFHHTIMDAASGSNLLHELLCCCAGVGPLPEPAEQEVAPAVETGFPAAYHGMRGLLRIVSYAAAQMADEGRTVWRARAGRKPAVRRGSGGHALTLELPAPLLDGLARRCRAEKVTLNSLLNAAQLLALDRCLYDGLSLPLRTFAFADLRPYIVPPVPATRLANYIAMLRFTLPVSARSPIWPLARDLHAQIYSALKHGDKFTATLLSERLLQMFVALKSMRMAAAALNYLGALPVAPSYGAIAVASVHGFVSGFDLGPAVASQARLFRDELWWDFVYLESDMSRAQAEQLVTEVLSILSEAAEAPAG